PQEYRAYYGKGLATSPSEHNAILIDAFRQATKLNPNFYPAWKELAAELNNYNYNNRTDLLESLAAYNQAIQLEPKIFSNYTKRGGVLESLKRYDEALASYNQSIKLQPYYALAYAGRGDVYLELEKYQSAISDYNRAKKLNAERSNIYIDHRIGIVYNRLKNYKSAISILTQALEKHPYPIASLQNSGGFGSELYVSRGFAYKKLKNYQAALADYTQAIKLNSDTPQPEIYFDRALLYYYLKDIQKGDLDLEKGIHSLKQDLSNDDEARVKDIANDFNNVGQPKAAQKIQRLILYVKASNYTSQGAKLADLEKYQEAIKLYTKAIEINPDDESTYHKRGDVYEDLENYQAAIADYTQAIEINPDDFDNDSYYEDRASVYEELKNYQAAIADYTKAIEIEPDDTSPYYLRASIHKRLKDYQSVIADYTKIIEINPNYA
ncbi:MAG: tetratricopeptide repeat protein, partial [Waterburya sp.]